MRLWSARPVVPRASNGLGFRFSLLACSLSRMNGSSSLLRSSTEDRFCTFHKCLSLPLVANRAIVCICRAVCSVENHVNGDEWVSVGLGICVNCNFRLINRRIGISLHVHPWIFNKLNNIVHIILQPRIQFLGNIERGIYSWYCTNEIKRLNEVDPSFEGMEARSYSPDNDVPFRLSRLRSSLDAPTRDN